MLKAIPYDFSVPKLQHNATKYCISIRRPTLWNNFLNNTTKTLTSLSAFQKAIKKSMIELRKRNQFISVNNNNKNY